MSRYDIAPALENFEVDTETPIAVRCAHWPRCAWATDFDGDDVVSLGRLTDAALDHLATVHGDVTAVRP
jgi:hypothetical protein